MVVTLSEEPLRLMLIWPTLATRYHHKRGDVQFSPDRLKSKNPACEGVRREAEERLGTLRRGPVARAPYT